MKLDILCDGRALPIFQLNGESFVPAPKGKEYTLRLFNWRPIRCLGVISVDGINVVDGKQADQQGNGYVVPPRSSVEIRGYLRDRNEAAAFTFSDVGGSYSSQMGHGESNVGVIGCAVFEEMIAKYERVGGQQVNSTRRSHIRHMVEPPTLGATKVSNTELQYSETQYSTGNTAAMEQAGYAAHHIQDTGTEYGRKVEMRTMDIAFLRNPAPLEVVKLRYASIEALRSWGVPVDAPRPPESPEPFPEKAPFVAAPPGYKG